MSGLDVAVLVTYLLGVAALGLRAGRRPTTAEEYTLAGRTLPAWAVGVSVLATETSALTFIGAPVQSLRGDWTYAQLALGSALGKLMVAALLLGTYYRHRVVTVYDFLGHRFGALSQGAATTLFVIGRLLGSGVRLYGGAIALVVVAGIPFPLAIVLIAGVAVTYSLLGGLRAVVWTDVLQGLLLLLGGMLALAALWRQVDVPVATAAELLRAGGDSGASKLRMLDFSFDLGLAYTFWAGLFGSALLTLSTHGTDQDMIQRALGCRDVHDARRGLWISAVLGVPVALLFLAVGSLLWLSFGGDSGAAARAAAVAAEHGFETASRGYDFLFPVAILETLPAGLRGLIVAALFATAMSSLDSAVTALASTTAIRFSRGGAADSGRRTVTRARVLTPVYGALLAGVALTVWWTEGAGDAQGGFGILALGLEVLTWIFPPLLGVFLVGAWTSRGNDRTSVVALAAGIGVLLGLEAWPVITGQPAPLAWTWNPIVGCGVSAAIAAVPGKSGAVPSSPLGRSASPAPVRGDPSDSPRDPGTPRTGQKARHGAP